MKTNNQNKGIPFEFAKKHLHRMEGRKVTLFVDQDKTWNVDLNFTSNNQFTLSGGWSKFRAHNNLKFGDICVFMLNKCKETISFQVAIFSLEKDVSTPYFEGNLFTCRYYFTKVFMNEFCISNYIQHELVMLVQGKPINGIRKKSWRFVKVHFYQYS